MRYDGVHLKLQLWEAQRRRKARQTATVLVFHSRLEIYCDIPCRRRRRRFTVCLWTVSRSHRVHLFKKTKNIFHFFIIVFLAKKKDTKKKCLSGALGGRDVCALTAVFSPCPGLFLRGCCKSSRFLSLDLQPEGGTSPDFGGYQAGTQRISRNRGLGTSILVPSLRKKHKLLDLPSSRVAPDSHPSTKQSLLPVSSICFCPPGGETAFYSTLDLNQGTWHEKGVEINQEEARTGQRSSRDLCHTPRLHSYLPVWCWKTDTVPLFWGEKMKKKKTSLNQSWNRQSGGRGISKTLFKRKTGLIMHMLVHIQYTARVHVCIWLGLLYPLSPGPSLAL